LACWRNINMGIIPFAGRDEEKDREERQRKREID